MKRSEDRILTTHVGSLVRPRRILEFMKAQELGQEYDVEEFDAEVSRAVSDVVAEQVDIGLDIPSDGEFARAGFERYIYQRLDGIEPRELDPGEKVWADLPERRRLFPGFYKQHDQHYRKLWMHPEVSIEELPNVPGNFERFRVAGPIGYRGHSAIQREIDNLRTALVGKSVADAFIPATHPGGRLHKDFLDFYPSEEAYRYALADAFHEEYRLITDAGFLLQIDYPGLHGSWLTDETADREQLAREAELGIEVLNYALRDIPEEMIRFHYCWGSMNVPHTTDAPLPEVLPLMLKAKAQAYSIEAANPRHEHEWLVWKDTKLPEGKILIPGVISHQTNVVEHPELVSWRLQNFASVVGKENVIAGTDCGFSQFWDSIRVHPEVQWAKLKSLTEGAALASKALWNS